MMWSQFDSAVRLMDDFKIDYKLREGKEEEYFAALKEWGLFQLTEEGFEYFFESVNEDE